jgi:Skp family chaperone for outer membrane proteins
MFRTVRLACAIVLFALAAAPLAAGDSGDAPKVAVLRLIDAIRGSTTYQARIETAKQEQAAIDAEVKKYDDEAQQLATSIEALPAGSEKLAALQVRLASTKAGRDAFVRNVTQRFESAQIGIIRDQYVLARKLLAEFCTQRGIKIVVQAAQDDIGARDFMLMNLRVEMQTALFWDADQDITDAFIAFMNAKATSAAPTAPEAK